jgi:hypothetical protein
MGSCTEARDPYGRDFPGLGPLGSAAERPVANPALQSVACPGEQAVGNRQPSNRLQERSSLMAIASCIDWRCR